MSCFFRFSSVKGRHFVALSLVLITSVVYQIATEAAETGEVIQPPIPFMTYVFTPGKLTGKEFTFEKNLCREFRFDQDLSYNKPKETVTLRFSLRGGYRAHDVFGHDDFVPQNATDVATGWVPIANGNFLIWPDKTKEHLPRFIPGRTKLVSVPFIKQCGDKQINGYDLALALDRVNRGEVESIPFRIVPSLTDTGAVYLIPTQPLQDGVYYAYSLSDDTQEYPGVVHGFLFGVGAPTLSPSTIGGTGSTPDFSLPAYRQDNPFWRSGNAPKSTQPNNPQLGNALGNCTWYANGRLRELGYSKDDLDKLIRDASKWYSIAQDNSIPVSRTPTLGSIAQTDSGANGKGHVAVVESQNADGSITVSESAFAGTNPSADSSWNFLYRRRTVAPSWFQNFIQVRKPADLRPSEAGSTPSQPPNVAATSSLLVDANLAKEVLDYALLSSAIYDFGTPKYVPVPNWEPINSSTLLLDEKQTVFSDPVNGFSAQVYVSGRRLAIVFEGTTQIVDWSTDIAAWLGAPPGQYQDALDFVGGIVAAAGAKYDVVLTGHSLGGGLAAYAALYYGKKAVVFNAAGLGGGMRSKIPGDNLTQQASLVTCVDVNGDPVSAFGKQMGVIYTLDIPKSWIGKPGWVDARDQAAVAAASLNPSLLGDAKPVNIDPAVYHSMDTVISALKALIK
jgi:surface antigen